MELIDKIKSELDGKEDVVKRMVLNGLIKFIDICKQPNFLKMVIVDFNLPKNLPGLGEEETLILKMEMNNVASTFSYLSDEEAQELKNSLEEERKKYSPEESESLEAFMREALVGKIKPSSESPLDGTLAGAYFAIAQGFGDERFNFVLVEPVNSEEIKEEIYRIITQYYRQKGMERIWKSDVLPGVTIWASAELNRKGRRQYAYCTVANSHILVTEKGFDW